MAYLCSATNPAQRRYRQGAQIFGAVYCVVFFTCTYLVRRLHPGGASLYTIALVPTLSIVGFLYVVGRYLREEKDEFVRDQFIRSLLWAIAAVMAFTMFRSFLNTFGWTGTMLPFAEWYVFCLTLLIAKFSYRFVDRVGADDE